MATQNRKREEFQQKSRELRESKEQPIILNHSSSTSYLACREDPNSVAISLSDLSIAPCVNFNRLLISFVGVGE